LQIIVTIFTLHYTRLTASSQDNLVKPVPDYQIILGFTALTDDQSMSAEQKRSRTGRKPGKRERSGERTFQKMLELERTAKRVSLK